MLGQLLDGRYRIIQPLGTGGFGHTYVAEDTRIPGNPKCVVKHLKPASNDSSILPTARRLFQNEAETLAKLGKHEHIPQLLAYFEQDKEFFLVQEFIEGHTLSTELPPGQRWPESQVIQLLQEILNILLFVVHAQGVIHRDIKPDNIIRRASDNKLVLIDFGAIKQVRNHLVTEQGQVSGTVAIGTPGYMPTEQSQGKPRPNSDIYALGMIAIQSLTGLYPQQLQEDINTGEIIWQHQAQASPGLAAILTKMVRYHFKDRYQSAAEAWQAVQQLVNAPYTQTAQTNFAASSLVHELTLEWLEAGQLRNQTISNKQPTKNPGTIRIGRDPAQCDIVLSDGTVSALHVEIFFNPQQQCFYLRNMRPTNPFLVNQQPQPTPEVVLSQGSSVRLGQMELKVTAIIVKQLSTPPQQPIAPTIQPRQVPDPLPSPDPDPPPTQSVSPIPTPPSPAPVSTSSSKLPLLIGVCVAAVVSLVSALVFIQGKGTIAGKRILDDNSNPLSAINNVSSSQKNCSVAVKGNIRSEPASFRNNVVKSVGGEQLLVTGKQTEGGWIEVKLADNKLGWAHKDVISNEAEMDSCLQQKGIPIKKVDDIPRPLPIVTPQNDGSDNTYKPRKPSYFSPYRKSRNNSDD